LIAVGVFAELERKNGDSVIKRWSKRKNVFRVGALVPFTDIYGDAYGDGRFRAAGGAIVVACEDFNARDGAVVGAFANATDCPVLLDCGFLDTRSDATATADAIFRMRGGTEVSPYDVIVGAVDFTVTKTIALIGALWEMPLVSYATTNAEMDLLTSPYFARTVVPDYAAVDAIASLCQASGWWAYTLLVPDSVEGVATAAALQAAALGRRRNADDEATTVAVVTYKTGGMLSLKAKVRTLDPVARVVVAVVADDDISALVDAASEAGKLGDDPRGIRPLFLGNPPKFFNILHRRSDPSRFPRFLWTVRSSASP